jgi:hypothetical protein
MQRVTTRPSVTWLLLLGLLVTSGVLTATRGLGRFDKAANCVGYGYGYASPATTLTLTLSKSEHNANTPVGASGALTQGGCGLKDETVLIQRRPVASGVEVGNWQTLSPRPTTGDDGLFSTVVYSVYNSVFRAVVPAKGFRPKIVSNTVFLKTHIAVSVYAPPGAHTSLARICGRTIPYKGGQRVTLYRYNNALQVWRGVQVTRVGGGSIYCFAVFLPAGRSTMAVSIPADTVNARGLRQFYEFRD